jgi:hypothetical protein
VITEKEAAANDNESRLSMWPADMLKLLQGTISGKVKFFELRPSVFAPAYKNL